jgi:hypothetical protein
MVSGDPPQDPCERCSKRGLTCQYTTVGEDNVPDPAPVPRPRPVSGSSTNAANQPAPLFPHDGGRGNTPFRAQTPQSQTHGVSHPNLGPNHSNPSTASRTQIPPNPAHLPRADHYAQHPSYGAQHPGALPTAAPGYSSATFHTSPYASQAYFGANTPNESLFYPRPATYPYVVYSMQCLYHITPVMESVAHVWDSIAIAAVQDVEGRVLDRVYRVLVSSR